MQSTLSTYFHLGDDNGKTFLGFQTSFCEYAETQNAKQHYFFEEVNSNGMPQHIPGGFHVVLEKQVWNSSWTQTGFFWLTTDSELLPLLYKYVPLRSLHQKIPRLTPPNSLPTFFFLFLAYRCPVVH